MRHVRLLEKQVCAARAWQRLPDGEKQPIVGLSDAERAFCYDMWRPDPEDLAWVADNPLVRLVDAVHAARPDLTARVKFGADQAAVFFTAHGQAASLAGFRRDGTRSEPWPYGSLGDTAAELVRLFES